MTRLKRYSGLLDTALTFGLRVYSAFHRTRSPCPRLAPRPSLPLPPRSPRPSLLLEARPVPPPKLHPRKQRLKLPRKLPNPQQSPPRRRPMLPRPSPLLRRRRLPLRSGFFLSIPGRFLFHLLAYRPLPQRRSLPRRPRSLHPRPPLSLPRSPPSRQQNLQ